MSKHDFEEDDEGVFKRHRWLMPLLIAAFAGGAWYAATHVKMDASTTAKPREHIMMVSSPPPPPPPPPKVEEKEPPKEEMVAQEEVKPDEAKPEEPKPSDDPPPISTGLTGDGPGMAGLGAYAPGHGNGTGIGGGGRKGGSKYGWFAAQVQRGITDALKRDERMRNTTFSVKARIWADNTGRIVRATLSGSTGDASIDAILTNNILSGLKLAEPPPADMPMPIVMRLNAKSQGSVASAR